MSSLMPAEVAQSGLFDAARLAVTLVEQAAAQKTFSGVGALLRTLTEELGADGCVLFQLSPATKDEALRDRHLIVSAQYFRDRPEPTWREVSLESNTGKNLQAAADAERRGRRHGEPRPPMEIHIEIGRLARKVHEEDPDSVVAQELGLRSYVSVPIWLGSELYGALNLCRCSEGKLLDEAVATFVAVAPMIPQLSVNIVNQTGFDLQRSIGELLKAGQSKPSPRTMALSTTLNLVAEKVAETFNTLAASIYLKPPSGEGVVHLEGTKWPWPKTEQPKTYEAGQSLTGGVFQSGLPRIVYNMSSEDLQDTYDFVKLTKDSLPTTIKGELPPLGWLGAPIWDGDRNLGVLRTFISKTGPYYFEQRHLDFLVLVARQIGDWVGMQRRVDRFRQESDWLQALVKGIGQLNQQVHDGWSAPVQNNFQRQLLVDAMKVALEAIPEAETLSVRMNDASQKQLRFVETLGAAWERGSAKEIEQRRNLRFPLDGKQADTAGAWVYRNRKTLLIADMRRTQFRSHAFPATQSMIVAPIVAGRDFFGTVDLRSERAFAFPDRAKNVADMIGRQLGLYLSLGRKISELNAAKSRLATSMEEQRMTFENLAHQLKTPVYLALRRATRLSDKVATDQGLHAEATALRGLCRRSEQIVKNVALFADLARDAPVTIAESTLKRHLLVTALIDAARDHALLLDPRRAITFQVEGESFQVLDQVVVRADLGLLDQMVGNLLDNAAKYSFPHTEVRIRGGLTRQGQYFYVGVANRGVAIAPEEAKTIVERGQRADAVIWKKQEGSGIGLYLVSEILAAHKGHLEILATNSQGITEFRLLFPLMSVPPKV